MKGLTLVEVLIAMGISVIVGALLLVIILNSSGLFLNQSSKVGQGLESNDALAKIRGTIRESSFIASVFPESGSPVYISGSGQLVLKLSSIDQNDDIILDVYDYFVFFLDTDKLRLKSFPDIQSARPAQDQILSLNVDSLKFQYFDSTVPPNEVSPSSAVKIKISLSLKQKVGQSFEVSIATTEASLRND